MTFTRIEMFDTKYEAPKREKVPTLKQYLAKLAKNSKELEQTFQVELIWLPGNFDNVTLETHKFRIILNDNHGLYHEILKHTGTTNTRKELGAFGIDVDTERNGNFQLVRMGKKVGEWAKAGGNGWRWKSN